MYKTTIPPHKVSFARRLEGRFALIAISAFVLLSATFAFATVFGDADQMAVAPPDPDVARAEAELKDSLDRRVHLHLKRLTSE